MKKLNRVTLFALATVVVLVAAAAYAAVQLGRARASYRAELAMRSALAEARQLQIATRALQSERADIQAIRRDWDEARATFLDSVERLHGALGAAAIVSPQLSRIGNTWQRMQGAHRQIDAHLNHLARQGVLARIGTSSLAVTYQEMLGQPDAPAEELGELGLLLFALEHVDRLENEIEFELRELSRRLEVRTGATVRSSLATTAAVLAGALLLVVLLLVRIARLYGALEVDNRARRAAEQAARASEADLGITLDSIGDAVFAADAAGILVRLNPAAASLAGVQAGAAVGRPVRDLFQFTASRASGDRTNPVDQVLTTGRVVACLEGAVVTRGDGSERQVSALATPIRDERQALAGVVLVVRDVTEQAKLQEQLRRAQKLESMGQLAGGVAHDFNNILQIVKANVAFLAEDPYLSAEARQFVNEIDMAENRAADLTRQLLALGRRQTLQFKELDPADLARSILNLTRRVLGEHIEIAFTAGDELGLVRGDPGQLEQVILNLCVNARDAMPGGGRLSLVLERVDISPEQVRAWSWARPGRHVRLSVSDTGSGIPPEVLERIFEPFFTTKPTGKGTGLGLSVVQGIVQQHGGFLGVYSEVGLGTTFHVFLPSYERNVEVADRGGEGRSAPPARAGGETILLVEDDAAVRHVAEAVLRRHGYRVLAAGDGAEGLAVAEANRESIRVAVLDVVMPRMGGVELARRLQTMRQGLPIVLSTGYAGGVDVPEVSASWGLLRKPYSNEGLIRAIQKSLGTGAGGDSGAAEAPDPSGRRGG